MTEAQKTGKEVYLRIKGDELNKDSSLLAASYTQGVPQQFNDKTKQWEGGEQRSHYRIEKSSGLFMHHGFSSGGDHHRYNEIDVLKEMKEQVIANKSDVVLTNEGPKSSIVEVDRMSWRDGVKAIDSRINELEKVEKTKTVAEKAKDLIVLGTKFAKDGLIDAGELDHLEYAAKKGKLDLDISKTGIKIGDPDTKKNYGGVKVRVDTDGISF